MKKYSNEKGVTLSNHCISLSFGAPLKPILKAIRPSKLKKVETTKKVRALTKAAPVKARKTKTKVAKKIKNIRGSKSRVIKKKSNTKVFLRRSLRLMKSSLLGSLFEFVVNYELRSKSKLINVTPTIVKKRKADDVKVKFNLNLINRNGF